MCMLRPSGRTVVVVLGQEETHRLISEVEAQSEDVYVVIFKKKNFLEEMEQLIQID